MEPRDYHIDLRGGLEGWKKKKTGAVRVSSGEVNKKKILDSTIGADCLSWEEQKTESGETAAVGC